MRKHTVALLAALAVAPQIVIPVSASPEPAVAAERLQMPPADREPDERASRGRNLFVSEPLAPPEELPNTTTTTVITTTTSTTSTTLAKKTASHSPTQNSSDVLGIARAQVGKRYVYGATGPNSFDCSGLVFYVFNQAGIKIPRLTTDGYWRKYPKVSASERQPGDLVLFSGHMGIYIGGNLMVHASTPRGGVKLAPISDLGRPWGYVRI